MRWINNWNLELKRKVWPYRKWRFWEKNANLNNSNALILHILVFQKSNEFWKAKKPCTQSFLRKKVADNFKRENCTDLKRNSKKFQWNIFPSAFSGEDLKNEEASINRTTSSNVLRWWKCLCDKLMMQNVRCLIRNCSFTKQRFVFFKCSRKFKRNNFNLTIFYIKK